MHQRCFIENVEDFESGFWLSTPGIFNFNQNFIARKSYTPPPVLSTTILVPRYCSMYSSIRILEYNTLHYVSVVYVCIWTLLFLVVFEVLYYTSGCLNTSTYVCIIKVYSCIQKSLLPQTNSTRVELFNLCAADIILIRNLDSTDVN